MAPYCLMNEILQLSSQCLNGSFNLATAFHLSLYFSPVPILLDCGTTCHSFRGPTHSCLFLLGSAFCLVGPSSYHCQHNKVLQKGIIGAQLPAVGSTGDLWKQMCSGPEAADIKVRVTVAHGHQHVPGFGAERQGAWGPSSRHLENSALVHPNSP